MAQKKYSVSGINASQAAPATIWTIIGSATVRPRLSDVVIGNKDTPADQAFDALLSRTTTTGTAGSNPTPMPLDPQEVAAVCTAGITHSAEPTYAATALLEFGQNQRATFRWVAAPDYELLGSATASNCLALKLASSTATMQERSTAFFFE